MYFSPLVIAVVSAIGVYGVGFSLLTNDQQNRPQDDDDQEEQRLRTAFGDYKQEERRRLQSLPQDDDDNDNVQPTAWPGFEEYKQQLAAMKDSATVKFVDNEWDVVPDGIPILRNINKPLLDLDDDVSGLFIHNMTGNVCKGSPDQIIAELKELNIQGLLYLHYVNRGFQSSGFNPGVINLEQKLRGLKYFDFNALMENLGDNLRLKTLWIGCYSDEGNHPYHRDTLKGDMRHIITIGSYQKQFWMKKGNKETGLFLPHGAMVSMDKNASGFSSNIKHSAKGRSDGSWVIIYETEHINTN